MHQGKLVFAQVMAHLPLSTLRLCVARYNGEHKVKPSPAWTSSTRWHGRSKVMFGTHCPMTQPVKPLEGLDSLGMDDEIKTLSLAGNAQRAFKLSIIAGQPAMSHPTAEQGSTTREFGKAPPRKLQAA